MSFFRNRWISIGLLTASAIALAGSQRPNAVRDWAYRVSIPQDGEQDGDGTRADGPSASSNVGRTGDAAASVVGASVIGGVGAKPSAQGPGPEWAGLTVHPISRREAVLQCTTGKKRLKALQAEAKRAMDAVSLALGRCHAEGCVDLNCSETSRSEMQFRGAARAVETIEAFYRPIVEQEWTTKDPNPPAVCARLVKEIADLEQSLTEVADRFGSCMAKSHCLKTVEAEGPIPKRKPFDETAEQVLLRLTASLQEPLTMVFHPYGVKLDSRIFDYGEPVIVSIDAPKRCLGQRGLWLDTVSFGSLPQAVSPTLSLNQTAVLPNSNVFPDQVEEQSSHRYVMEAPSLPGQYRFRVGLPSRFGGRIVSVSEPFAVIPPPTEKCNGFHGTWETNFGTLRLAERDGKISGSYRKSQLGQSGYVFGVAKGGVLRGHWQSEFGRGGLRIALNEERGTFSGTWSRFLDEYAGDGHWEGVCVTGTETADMQPR